MKFARNLLLTLKNVYFTKMLHHVCSYFDHAENLDDVQNLDDAQNLDDVQNLDEVENKEN